MNIRSKRITDMDTKTLKALIPLITKAINRQAEDMAGKSDTQYELSLLLRQSVSLVRAIILVYCEIKEEEG
jgi:hypothetical protein